MEWFVTFVTVLEGFDAVIALLAGLGGLIGTYISTYFAIKAVIEKNKGKSLADIWELVMVIADDAMKAAEASGKKVKTKRKWFCNSNN